MNPFKDVAAELAKLRVDVKTLRKFSLTIAAVLAAIGIAVHIWGTKTAAPWLWAIAGGLAAGGLLLPSRLGPIYKAWMGLAFFLGWFVSRIILSLLFYLVITPIGVVMRLFGKKFLVRMETSASTYWVPRAGQKRTRESYEKLF